MLPQRTSADIGKGARPFIMSASLPEPGDVARSSRACLPPLPRAKTDGAIHALKGIAIVGVIFHHVQNRRFSSEMNAAIEILPALFSWCVLLFFAISGWLHSLAEERNPKTIGMFLRNRTRRLLVPFAALVLLYAAMWQVVQAMGIGDMGARLSTSFWTKIVQSVPGCDYNPVAEQLYFLPILFIVGSVIHLSFRLLGLGGVWGCTLGGAFAGMILTPDSGNTGPSSGVILFGGFCYASGFLMHRYRNFSYRIAVVLAVALLFFLVLGIEGLPKVVPLLMIECMHQTGLSKITPVCLAGEASGTIYAYHTPFILAPLVILVAQRPETVQFAGVLAAGFFCVAICSFLFLLSGAADSDGSCCRTGGENFPDRRRRFSFPVATNGCERPGAAAPLPGN
ncbi:hypothetical protein OPIT5_30860 [Opitutaceae bacterium TAV5]|nr:hypothetical protein OPIT5_30860 [Opitutaceae bacterium TAV5]